MQSILLFIPEVGIYPYARGLVVLGDSYIQNQDLCYITNCTGQMYRCPIFSMTRLSSDVSIEKKKEICQKCKERIIEIRKEYNFKEIDLDKYVSAQLYNTIDNLVDNKFPNELQNLSYEGFAVGKIVLYDFILETKFPYSSDLSKEQINIYRLYIKNTILTIHICHKILEEISIDLLVTFNEYAQCQAVRFSAEIYQKRRMALTYPVYLNVDASRFMLWEKTCEAWRYSHIKNWHKYKDVPISPENVLACWKDSYFRMSSSGSHIFSNKKANKLEELYKELKLKENCKKIVAFTSSEDERLSVETAMDLWGETTNIYDCFPDQISWLKFLEKYTKENHSVQIIIRIHPREGLKQFGLHSKNLQKIQDNFSNSSVNFIIIWPDNPISSYDLLEIADACLIQWSLMGLEACRLGIPVISYTANMLYPNDDFIKIAKTQDEYKELLIHFCNKKFKWEQLLHAVRFFHWRIFIPAINLGEYIPQEFENTGIWPHLDRIQSENLRKILIGERDLIENNLRIWERNINKTSYKEEFEAMCYGIRYFIDRLYFPNIDKVLNRSQIFLNKISVKIFEKEIFKINVDTNLFNDYELKIITNNKKNNNIKKCTKQNKKLRFIVLNGSYSTLFFDGKKYTRFSPLISSIIRLYSDYIKSFMNME